MLEGKQMDTPVYKSDKVNSGRKAKFKHTLFRTLKGNSKDVFPISKLMS